MPPLPSSADTVSELQVTLRDCEGLLRRGVVGLPGAVTRSGRPLLTFPDNYRYIITSAANRSIGSTTGCTITEKAPTRA